MPTLLIHDLLGPQDAALLGVPAPSLDQRWVTALRSVGARFDGEVDEHAFIRAGAPIVGRLLLKGLMLANRGPGRAAFNIPRALRQAHQLL